MIPARSGHGPDILVRPRPVPDGLFFLPENTPASSANVAPLRALAAAGTAAVIGVATVAVDLSRASPRGWNDRLRSPSPHGGTRRALAGHGRVDWATYDPAGAAVAPQQAEFGRYPCGAW